MAEIIFKESVSWKIGRKFYHYHVNDVVDSSKIPSPILDSLKSSGKVKVASKTNTANANPKSAT